MQSQRDFWRTGTQSRFGGAKHRRARVIPACPTFTLASTKRRYAVENGTLNGAKHFYARHNVFKSTKSDHSGAALDTAAKVLRPVVRADQLERQALLLQQGNGSVAVGEAPGVEGSRTKAREKPPQAIQ